MAETATGTIYQSAAILFATAAFGLTGAASLKILMGFLGAAILTFAPLTKWMTFHLPRRLREARHPQREFALWTLIGGLAGIALYAVMLVVGRPLIPLVCGSRYASAAALVPAGGLIAVVGGFSLNLSIISKMYNLVWTFVIINSVVVLLGLAFLASPWRPLHAMDIYLLRPLSLPASVFAIAIAYRRYRAAAEDHLVASDLISARLCAQPLDHFLSRCFQAQLRRKYLRYRRVPVVCICFHVHRVFFQLAIGRQVSALSEIFPASLDAGIAPRLPLKPVWRFHETVGCSHRLISASRAADGVGVCAVHEILSPSR